LTERLLVVGWDAADWKLIRPLLAKGEMPHLAKVMAEGAWGNLSTIQPALSPMVWTSIATGKRPYKHGIHGFTEPTPDGMSVRPITNLGRKVKAFWNILNQHGKRSIVAGWWPSHPAEPIRGAMVSDRYPVPAGRNFQAPMPQGAVWPPEWSDRLAELRVMPDEISGHMLQVFMPQARNVDQEKDRSLADLAGIVAETMSLHAAATDLLENEPWDLAAVYYTGIDHFSHRFMRYHAGKGMASGSSEAAWFAEIMQNAYRYHDAMLGRLLTLAGQDCPVLVLSDHGFHSDRLLPDYLPAEGAAPALEHREYGIFCLRAPGVARGRQIYGASVLDIAPTVLHLFGLPSAKDMDGRPILSAFEDPTLIPPIESWEEVAGEDGRHPASLQYDGGASAESLKQLVALGYVAPPGKDAADVVTNTLRENRYHLAEAYTNGGRYREAVAILEELLAEDGEQARFYRMLFDCQLQCGELDEAGRVLDRFDAACAVFVPRSQAEFERRREALKGKEQEALPRGRETFELRVLAEKATGYVFERVLMRTKLVLGDRSKPQYADEAGRLLEELSAMAGKRSGAALFLAEGFARLEKYERALQYVKRARAADRENWRAITLEAQIHQRTGDYQKAAGCAVDSLSLLYFQPATHYLLGVCLHELGEKAEAEQSLRVALAQNPGLLAAHEALGRLLRGDTERLGEAALHAAKAQVGRQKVKERRAAEPEAEPAAAPAMAHAPFQRFDGPPADRSRVVTVVTGLPRSGTSMMMQMLRAGGVEAYTDGKREADEDNPNGYFEHHDAARLNQDAAWVPAARGLAVKIVAQLVPHLPAGEEYRVVFMLRNPREVVASQRAMLKRLGRDGAKLDDATLIRTYTSQLVRVQTWLRSAANVQVIPVDYGEAVGDSAGAAGRLAEFLGQPFDEAAAAAAVDPGFRRQRAG
jgi:predicted AlkP superfamily phosphohydrolase/phosphomutase/tetratricopeptide (TPR) repeat protein